MPAPVSKGQEATSASSASTGRNLLKTRSPDDKPDLVLDELELSGRVRPDMALRQLEALLAAGGESRRIWAMLRLKAAFLLDLERPEAVHAVADQLRRSTVDPGISDAEPYVMAACMEAMLALRGFGPLRPAHMLLQQWMPQMPPDMPLLERMACVSASSSIAERLGRFDEAVSGAQEAHRMSERLGGWRVPVMLGRLARILKRTGDDDNALRLVDEAIALASREPKWTVLAELSTVRVVVLPDAMSGPESLPVYQKAVDWARKSGSPREQALALANLSDHFLRQRQWQHICEMREPVRALTRIIPYALAEETADQNCGLALIQQRRLNEGLAILNRLLDQYRRADDLVSLSEALFELGQVLEHSGFPKEALAAYLDARGLEHERSRRDQELALLEAREAFEAERRRRDKAMLVAENQLKAEELDQQQLRWREWALASGIAAMLLIGLGLWYSRLRAEQRLLQAHQDELRAESEQDPLTGLANRRFIQRQLGGEDNALTPDGALYLIDLDHFKRVNDVYGHSCGDRVLVEVARRLRAVLREEDKVVRWGGEEFLVLVGPRTQETADALSQRLLAALAMMPVSWGEEQIPVTASIGFASFPLGQAHAALPWGLALRLVDGALYLAKSEGRNRACGLRHLPELPEPGQWQTWYDLSERLGDAWRGGEVELNIYRGPAAAGRPWPTLPPGLAVVGESRELA